MKLNILLLSAAAALTPFVAMADDFFSTAKPENLVGLGVRIGVNTSNRTIGKDVYPNAYHSEGWRTGFDIGITADLNIRDYLAIQPGFFFESRNSTYTLMGKADGSDLGTSGVEMGQSGNLATYNFTIPVMAVFRFNVTDNVRWNVEVGPYVAFNLNSKLKNKKFIYEGEGDYSPLFSQEARTTDFGFKMGTGLQLFDHYYVAAHYLAGCLPAWKPADLGGIDKKFAGCTKAWVFTIGYDF